MYNLLLTGSNGFVGQYVAFAARRTTHVNLTGWSARPTIHDFCNEFCQIDFLQTEITADMLRGFDAVIHTAAISQVDYCEVNRIEAFRVNVEAARQIAIACKETGTHLVHVSSDFVMEGASRFVTEQEPTNPVNYYGRTKEMAELAVLSVLPSATIVRPVLIFGNVLSGTRSNLVLWVKNSLEKQNHIRVTSNHYRTATFVPDLAELLVKCALNPAPGLFHACGASYLSVYEMAVHVANRFGYNPSLIEPVHSNELDAAPRPPCTWFSAQKATNQFGFVSRSFSDALSMM